MDEKIGFDRVLIDKIRVSDNTCEQKMDLLIRYYEESILILKTEEGILKEPTEANHLEVLGKLEQNYAAKVEKLEREIEFLNERHECQHLMFSDTLVYVNELKAEIAKLIAESKKE